MAVTPVAGGLGVNTAIFSVVNALLLRLLPVKNPSELVGLVSDPRLRSAWAARDPINALRGE